MDYSNRFKKAIGILRSLIIYYGIPFRRKRLSKFYRKFIQPDDLCFDIGAHVGNRIRAFSDLSARVVAVEPQPECNRVLRKRYGAHPQVTLVEKAIGTEVGTQQLFISQWNPTVSTLSNDWITAVKALGAFADVQWEESIAVEVTTLDALIEEYGKPAFCKIDVEGYEFEVLRGLTVPIRAISFEYTPVTEEVSQRCLRRLDELGNYQFNWSLGETHSFQSKHWLTYDEMSEILKGIGAHEKSGDIYAILR